MCLYGAKASWSQQTALVEACRGRPGPDQANAHHYLFVCAPAQSFFKPLCSVPEAAVLERQRVHLILVCVNTHIQITMIIMEARFFRGRRLPAETV